MHKLLTGRIGGFDRLRRCGGMSGYPNRAESPHDVIENSHASTALSYADGFAKAFQLRGQTGRHVVAVVGDGAMTGGMCWEALTNIGAASDRPVIVVLNDNGRSYSPTVGSLAEHLRMLRLAVPRRTLSAAGRLPVRPRGNLFTRPRASPTSARSTATTLPSWKRRWSGQGIWAAQWSCTR